VKIAGQNEPLHSLDLWNFVLDVNLTGTFNPMRLKHMVHNKPGERGIIALVSSSAVYETPPGQAAYSATKSAVRSMVMLLARHSIRVMAIAPNLFVSSMSDKLPTNARRRCSCLSRLRQPTEFAETVE
jgi:3-hydroxyacyl-CoA dehydrogenase / 3-hydroxy-2-methylbutyryl-CoA dehydrogenase